MHSPLEQFTIKPYIPLHLFKWDISLTNAAFAMMASAGLAFMALVLATHRKQLVPGKFQAIAEILYDLVLNMIKETVGSEGKPYFGFVFSIFLFLITGNLVGMLPFSFTFTSQIIITFSLAAIIFFLITFLGFAKHGFKFLRIFFPAGTSVFLAPFIIPVEIISYFSRPLSLALRLFANIMAGHTMMKVFAGFSVMLGVIGGIFPLLVNVILTGFEIMVAVVQAYIFAIMSCVYLNDALHMH